MAAVLIQAPGLMPALLVAVAGLLVWAVWRWRRHFAPLRQLPAPPGVPLLGNIPAVLSAVRHKRFFQLLHAWSQAYGPVFVYWAGKPVVVLSRPDLIENTIVQGMRSGSLIRSPGTRQAWNDMRGPILIGEEGPAWQWRRRAWNPEFTTTSVAAHLPLLQQASAQVLERLEQAPAGQAIALDPLFVELAMRVIAALMLGIPVEEGAATPEGPPLDVARTYDAMAVLGYRFLRLATGESRWLKFLPIRASRQYWAARRQLDDLLATRVALALRLRDGEAGDEARVAPLFRQSLLVRMAAKEPRYDQDSLIAEAIEFLIAGTDTTAHTLSFAAGSLALHPDVLARVRQEVDQAWERHGGLTPACIGALDLVRGVIKETLRLFSVASGSTSLQVVKQTDLAGIGQLPVGTFLIWSMLGAGRDPQAYPRPLEFLPERWLQAGAGAPLPPMIDFGSGTHRCIGEHLAMLEATVMLAQLLRHYDWELVNGPASLENQEQNLLIYPADGMPVRIRPRVMQAGAGLS
ncbi:cytochrome P450 [Synechococcus sp. BA-124 BA4]|uniref:cytochrome P450 n=1 Tax=unclassified Synechococcus TaxID=2626047 RepID=UPI001E536A5D|nr:MULTISPECIES: cytochrome P450 [unclassified Synechococcus]MEA5399474.1 cytochrome P450 [Synechococcus sp. BA-124 BA4]